uniref:Uncharacterized protein n=1 Tax=Globodera rostochiensis TaxID=31243 RepID=A0A914HJ17_GLORO
MNLSTIGIIFVLFFCSAAWAGPFRPRSKIVPSSSNTPSPQINASDPGSKSFSTRLMEGAINYYLTGTDSDYLNPEQQQQQQQQHTSQSIRRTNFFGDGTGTGNSNSSGGRNKTRRNTTKTVAPLHLPEPTDHPVADPPMAFGNEPPRPISMSASQQQQQQQQQTSSSPRSRGGVIFSPCWTKIAPSSSSNTPSPQWFSTSSSSNTPSPQWFNASDPDSESFTENQIEDAIHYCHETNVSPFHLPEPTDHPVADPSKSFPSEEFLQAVLAEQQSHSGGRGHKNGQLKSRKKIDGRCHQTNVSPFHLPELTDHLVADPSMFFPTEAFLQDQAVPASQQQRPQTASSSHSAGGRKNGQLNSRKKVDGRLPKNFLSDSAGGDRT